MSQQQHKPREIHQMYGWVIVGKKDGMEHHLHFKTKEEAIAARKGAEKVLGYISR